MCNFPSGNIPSLPIAACGASEGLKPKLWEVAAWKIAHLGSRLGICTWEIPNTVKNRLQYQD